MRVALKQESGFLDQVIIDQDTVLHGMSINLFRAPTDNDEGGSPVAASYAKTWRKAGLDNLSYTATSFQASKDLDHPYYLIEGEVEGKKFKGSYTLVYEFEQITSTLDVMNIYMEVNRKGDLPLPRVGLHFLLDPVCEDLEWIGRGPWSTYPDRKEGGFFDLYHTTIMEDYVPYIKPQEYGNKTDVSWIEVQRQGKPILQAKGLGQTVNLSYHPFNIQELSSKAHDYELSRDLYHHLYIDEAVMGVGGDLSWAPATHEEFLLREEKYSMKIQLRFPHKP